jgi:hypothetical protein
MATRKFKSEIWSKCGIQHVIFLHGNSNLGTEASKLEPGLELQIAAPFNPL